MTKLDITTAIAEKTGVEQTQVKLIVQLTLDSIIEVLATERRLELRDFGVFTIVDRKARKGRNPKTGQPVDVPTMSRVRFKGWTRDANAD